VALLIFVVVSQNESFIHSDGRMHNQISGYYERSPAPKIVTSMPQILHSTSAHIAHASSTSAQVAGTQDPAASSSALKNVGLLQKTKKEKEPRRAGADLKKNYKIGYLPSPFEPDEEGGARVAIIIPYRARRNHLMRFLDHFAHLDPHTVLYDMYVIEQDNDEKFNRGLLLDIGYLAAHSKNSSYDRYIFHDVDSYPDQTLFSQYGMFLDNNIHYASPKLGYKYKYDRFVGGVIGTSAADFEKINGFSTFFSGWGGEDDSFYTRMAVNSVPLYRPSSGRYALPDHDRPTHAENNTDKRKNLVYDSYHWRTNGLGQLSNKGATYKFVGEPEFFGNRTARRRVSVPVPSPDLEPKRVSPSIRCFFVKAAFSAINFTMPAKKFTMPAKSRNRMKSRKKRKKSVSRVEGEKWRRKSRERRARY
jgi:hypothetical protein